MQLKKWITFYLHHTSLGVHNFQFARRTTGSQSISISSAYIQWFVIWNLCYSSWLQLFSHFPAIESQHLPLSNSKSLNYMIMLEFHFEKENDRIRSALKKKLGDCQFLNFVYRFGVILVVSFVRFKSVSFVVRPALQCVSTLITTSGLDVDMRRYQHLLGFFNDWTSMSLVSSSLPSPSFLVYGWISFPTYISTTGLLLWAVGLEGITAFNRHHIITRFTSCCANLRTI